MTAPLPNEVLQLLNHIEDVVGDEAWRRIDARLWNAVTKLASGVIGTPAAEYLAKVEAAPERAAALQRARERAANGVGESSQAKALRDPPEVIAAEYDRMVMRAALRQIAAMDPKGQRADDLGRAARVARDALADGVTGTQETKESGDV